MGGDATPDGRERAELLGPDELMEALAADAPQFGYLLDREKPLTSIRSGRHPIGEAERRCESR
jgi:hypothetical protein